MIINEIIADRDWRMRELEFLKKLDKRILYGHLSESELNAYYRMCIPIIYAHWEGFIVVSFKALINFINKQNLTKDEIINNLFTFSHRDTFRTLSGKQSFKQRCEFSEKFITMLSEPITIETKLFSTKSNLNYDMLKEAVSWFNISIEPYSKYKYSINKLVNVRNAIAHGEDSIKVTYANIENYIKIVNELFDITIMNINNYLTKRLYIVSNGENL